VGEKTPSYKMVGTIYSATGAQKTPATSNIGGIINTPKARGIRRQK